MTDVFPAQVRSAIMKAVRDRDTAPELAVRSLLHQIGYRYRLHVRSLPGTPDIVFPSRKKIVLVHGCFWHRHRCDAGRSFPASRIDYWRTKFAKNCSRDKKNQRTLRRGGWGVLVIWECQTSSLPQIAAKLTAFLGPTRVRGW